MRLKEIRKIECEIEVLTGLHIGAGNDEISIGGVDNIVLRDPLTDVPYIPGSSLKGKIRSLAEWSTGCIDKDGGAFYLEGNSSKIENEDGKTIVKIFGNGKPDTLEDDSGEILQTRLSVSDAFMTAESKEKLKKKLGTYTETKYEVSINRKTGTVGGGGPRQIERVPAGTKFQFEAFYKIFEKEGEDIFQKNEEEAFEKLLSFIDLLNYDALGGGGSRGNGRVKINKINSIAVWLKPEQKSDQSQS